VDSVPLLTNWVAAEAAQDPTLASLRATGVRGNDQLAGTAGDDVFVNLASLSSFRAGTGQDILIGNDRADRLYGDDGNDQLFGAAGDDTLMGGNGQDRLLGGAGKDSLSGAMGDDLLQGGLGNDSLTGGTGNDRYVFAAGDGQDRIIENDSQGDSQDVLAFAGDITSSQLWFRQVANDLEISVIGTQDKVTVRTWFSDPGARLERIDTAGDGLSLKGAGVDALVAAMATMQAPLPGAPISEMTTPTLSPVMAANWLSAG
jgi:Ca2+-binding RTX toxin-like protein